MATGVKMMFRRQTNSAQERHRVEDPSIPGGAAMAEVTKVSARRVLQITPNTNKCMEDVQMDLT